MKLLIFGSTGLVGRHLLSQALADERISAVTAPARRVVMEHPKLVSPVIDFERLPKDETWWQADALICALGTTMRNAGSEDAFLQIDYDYPIAIARLAHAHHTPTFVLTSAIGANLNSRFFYNRVKGEVERALEQIGFDSLTFVRPGLIGGDREVIRPWEAFAGYLLKLFGPLFPRRWRLNPAKNIARALLEAAIASKPGRHVVPAEDLV